MNALQMEKEKKNLLQKCGPYVRGVPKKWTGFQANNFGSRAVIKK